MRPVATDVAHRVVCVSVCLCVLVHVCVCVLSTRVSCAKTAELTEMAFGGPDSPCIRWGPDPTHGKWQFWGLSRTLKKTGSLYRGDCMQQK